MTADLISLAERCEQATGPDRTLDRDIATAIGMDWPNRGPFAQGYSASLDAARRLVPEGWHVGVLTECGEDDAPHCCLTENDEPCRDAVGDGPNMALSLCAASLRARSAMESNTNG